jgi:hypothetical protein
VPVEPAPGVETAAAPVIGTSGAAGAAGRAGGKEDDEELVQRLFPPILRRLKSELLLDRERRGRRTDAW